VVCRPRNRTAGLGSWRAAGGGAGSGAGRNGGIPSSKCGESSWAGSDGFEVVSGTLRGEYCSRWTQLSAREARTQFLHGRFSSHLIFFLRQYRQERRTRARFTGGFSHTIGERMFWDMVRKVVDLRGRGSRCQVAHQHWPTGGDL
jgi:hypothetical protein